MYPLYAALITHKFLMLETPLCDVEVTLCGLIFKMPCFRAKYLLLIYYIIIYDMIEIAWCHDNNDDNINSGNVLVSLSLTIAAGR